jgi:site-specific recombinase XerD
MRFDDAIDLFVSDMASQGRLTSPGSERAYRDTLYALADEVGNRDPRTVTRHDVKHVLRRWAHPNTQRKNRSVLISFFDWSMEEGYRKDNPARQTRRPKRRLAQVYRLTREEVARMLTAATSIRERRVIFLGICAGLRNQELRGLQGRHFERPGWIWVSADIAKGARERWIPVIYELEPVVNEIRRNVLVDEYVVPAQRKRIPGPESHWVDRPFLRSSPQALYRLVLRVGERAGISAPVHPHLMRHAFGDHIARFAGMRNAQFLLGHADVSTTETYVGAPTLDELRDAISGFAFERTFSPLRERTAIPLIARRGFEPLFPP